MSETPTYHAIRADQLGAVLQYLSRHPYNEVAPIIQVLSGLPPVSISTEAPPAPPAKPSAKRPRSKPAKP